MTDGDQSGPPDEGRNYSVEEIAAMLRVTGDAVYRAIGRGELESFRVGRTIRVSGAAYLKYTGRVAS